MRHLAVVLAVTLAGSAAYAAPDPDFDAVPVQGPVCVAPCAVHFDAIGDGSNRTTDPAFGREFHTLLFEWDFDDAGSGTWPVSGHSRNQAVGGIAGHLYDAPGSYSVTLTVTNPDGQSGSIAKTVTVTDPDAHFATGETWCFANGGTPGGAGFEACPVSAASQHVVIGSGVFDGVNQALRDHCSVRSGQDRRCLFRRGDTFRLQGEVVFRANAGVGLVSAFGSGARPRVLSTGSFGAFADDHWTVAHLDTTMGSTQGYLVKLQNEIGNATLYDVRALETGGGCFVSQGTAASTHSDLVAVVGVECIGSPTGQMGGGGFFRTERTLVLGTIFDNNYQGEFAFRTIHFPRSVLQHSELSRPQDDLGNTRNVLQLRAWNGTANNQPGMLPTPTNTEYVIVSDNLFRQANEDTVVRTCQGNECADAPDSPELQHVIFERNFFHFTTDGCCGGGGMTRGFWLQGGDITVRNNVLDLQGVVDGNFMVRLVHQGPSNSGTSNDDRIHVLHNTVYFDDAVSDDFLICGSAAAGTDHRCQNNLVHAPNHTGNELVAQSGWSASGNVFASTLPFAQAPPAQGQTEASDFRLAGGASGVVDAGAAFGSLTSRVPLDFGLGCRPEDGPDAGDTAEWDVGAWEYGAAACMASGPGDPGLQPPEAPILLP